MGRIPISRPPLSRTPMPAPKTAVLPEMSTGLLLPGLLEWPLPLFDYQVEGVMALASSDALLLADDMGLGKTVQAIGALRLLVLQRLAEAALVIVPAGLVAQ